ncbi:erythromycin esterase family protein [Streptomyces sp. PSKA30]|uniref:erythromycin esterase family protein n=1 Tax=Streptomyces sp. PSKA30 TaxID=2874597 RepID=UPI001CD177CB|nr:erythromycin esterase family protein [Streptomyces sp. PSKA30]MBZ9639227.1 erythromycin esterase family protein [Streptomyces sp. PSKA30]
MSDTDQVRIRDEALPLSDAASLDPLLERIGDARYVLLGEASHGTADYYQVRDVLTRRLIEEKGFSFVAVEGDWPDCQAVHCSVVAAPGSPEDPGDVLAGFRRWPAWLWGNTDVATFARWLRRHNEERPPERRVGFFGLDVYSMWESLHAVLGHLREHDPDRVDHALEAYRCFEPYAEDPQSYAVATRILPEGCEPQVVSLLTELRQRAAQTAVTDGSLAEFAARQNAEVLAGAERYYRAMLSSGPESWNIRDHHMADTLDRLMERYGSGAKAVVWEHNTHIGDARATDMADRGLVNVGQSVRERHMGDGVVLVGFGSHSGTVIAAEGWGDVPRIMDVPPAHAGSLEDLLHQALPGQRALFVFPHVQLQRPPVTGRREWFHQERGHRAIGVVYRAQYEPVSNYVPTVLAQRYDAFCYLDRTDALTPLGTGEPAPRRPATPAVSSADRPVHAPSDSRPRRDGSAPVRR